MTSSTAEPFSPIVPTALGLDFHREDGANPMGSPTTVVAAVDPPMAEPPPDSKTQKKNGDREKYVFPERHRLCYDYGGRLRDCIYKTCMDAGGKKRRKGKVSLRHAQVVDSALPIQRCPKQNIQVECPCNELLCFVHFNHVLQIQQVYINFMMWGGCDLARNFLKSLMLERFIDGKKRVILHIPVFFPQISRCRVFYVCRQTFQHLFDFEKTKFNELKREAQKPKDPTDVPLFGFDYDNENPANNAYFFGTTRFKIGEHDGLPWSANVAEWKEHVRTTQKQRDRETPNNTDKMTMIPALHKDYSKEPWMQNLS